MKAHFLLFVALLNSRQIAALATDDYYWRGCTGKFQREFPKDALVVGQDPNGDNIYVGQANIYKAMVVFEAGPGSEMLAPYSGATKIRNTAYVKILCTKDPTKFYWGKATAADLHVQMLDKQPVVGGRQSKQRSKGKLFVGRVRVGGRLRIGKVLPFRAGNAEMFFVHGGEMRSATSYEVLLYNGTEADFSPTPRTTTTTTSAPRTTTTLSP